MCYVSVYMKTQVAVNSEMLQPFIWRSTNALEHAEAHDTISEKRLSNIIQMHK